MLVSTDVPRVGSAGKSRPNTASIRDDNTPLVESRNTNDRYNHGNAQRSNFH